MALDSTAVFALRIKELGLEEITNNMEGEGWNTHAAFAYSCAYTPGTADDASFQNDVVFPILGNDPRKLKTTLKRLYFESHMAALLDVQRRATPSDDTEKPKKLPAPEKVARIKALRKRLTGVSIEGELEPSHALIDRFNGMFEDGALRFVPWEDLTRRDEEIKNVKKLPYFNTDKDGRLKFNEETKEQQADIRSELKLQAALKRRGLALEAAKLMTWEMHEKYLKWLYKAYAKDAKPGYHPVSLEQIHTTDQEVFVKLASLTEEGLGVLPDQSLVMDNLILSVMQDPDVSTLLVPFQKSAPSYVDRSQQVKRTWDDFSNVDPKGNKGKGRMERTRARMEERTSPRARTKATAKVVAGKIQIQDQHLCQPSWSTLGTWLHSITVAQYALLTI